MKYDKYFEPEAAIQLTQIRDEMRRKNSRHRLTYDCIDAKVNKVGKVYCGYGYPLSDIKDKALSLLPTLRGRSSSICQTCADYDGETDEG